MGIIEVMDGFSRDWGYSHSDMLANLSGAALFAAQQYGWGAQRINLKMSARYTPFAAQNISLLGNNFASRLLKDYNGQTYWLSFNVASFLPASTNIPDWAQVSLGYGATGMIHAKEKEGSLLSNDQSNRYRRFFLAPDVDWSRFHSSDLPAAGLYITRFIKTPAPAIEFNQQQKIKFNWIYLITCKLTVFFSTLKNYNTKENLMPFLLTFQSNSHPNQKKVFAFITRVNL
jgi:hypothetical protein